jgi:hypothetical protein
VELAGVGVGAGEMEGEALRLVWGEGDEFFADLEQDVGAITFDARTELAVLVSCGHSRGLL